MRSGFFPPKISTIGTTFAFGIIINNKTHECLILATRYNIVSYQCKITVFGITIME